MTRPFSRPSLSRELLAYPEEVWDAVKVHASQGQVVGLSDLVELPDEQVRVTISNLTHQAFAPQPVVEPLQVRKNRWTLWHTGILASAAAIALVLAAITYLVYVIVVWVSAHQTQVAIGVVICAVSIGLVSIGIANARRRCE